MKEQFNCVFKTNYPYREKEEKEIKESFYLTIAAGLISTNNGLSNVKSISNLANIPFLVVHNVLRTVNNQI